MKVEDFRSARQPKEIPGQMTVEEAIAEVEQETVSSTETVEFTSLTPSGIEVAYSPAPRRHYKVRQHRNPGDLNDVRKILTSSEITDWQEVPSVTTVLGVLDKSGPLTWWSQGNAVEGLVEMIDREVYWPKQRIVMLEVDPPSLPPVYAEFPATKDNLVKALVQQQLSCNHTKNKAADRGASVHKAFEAWCADPEYRPNPELFEENERGYITALAQFLEDIDGYCSDIESELMVGSIEHGYAGRFDCRLTKDVSNLVVKAYPKRENKVAETPAGKWLIDVKTSKSVYPTHALQLAAYELASVECGYGPTDYRAVLHLQSDGQYELVQTHAQAEDWLSVLATYQTMQKTKGWM